MKFTPLLFRSLVSAALAASAVGSAAAADVTVYSNNPGGDAFTNPGPSNAAQLVGATGWVYNNVRNGGSVGIADTLPLNGNGSVYMSGPANAKADIEYYGALGSFSSFTAMSYDWYRDSSSTAAAHFHPSLRILLDKDGDISTNDRVSLIFERAYNPSVSPVPTNTWTSDFITGSTILWNSGAGVTPTDQYRTLTSWLGELGTAQIIGFSSGIGSGWDGTYAGAVDNISWTIGGVTTSTNFEVSAVPEPTTVSLALFGLVGLGIASRRRKS